MSKMCWAVIAAVLSVSGLVRADDEKDKKVKLPEAVAKAVKSVFPKMEVVAVEAKSRGVYGVGMKGPGGRLGANLSEKGEVLKVEILAAKPEDKGADKKKDEEDDKDEKKGKKKEKDDDKDDKKGKKKENDEDDDKKGKKKEDDDKDDKKGKKKEDDDKKSVKKKEKDDDDDKDDKKGKKEDDKDEKKSEKGKSSR